MVAVALVGTLDTKGTEYAFVADRLRALGVDVVVIDCGILGPPPHPPDIDRAEVAAAAGADVEQLAAAGDRGAAVQTMSRGPAWCWSGWSPRAGSAAHSRWAAPAAPRSPPPRSAGCRWGCRR